MSLPGALLVELRHAFRTCARCSALRPRTFAATTRRFQGSSAPPPGRSKAAEKASGSANPARNGSNEHKDIAKSGGGADPSSSNPSTDVVPRGQDGRALDGDHRPSVPMKVIPKAHITPNLRLKPLERLHIEQITRRTPVKATTKAFQEQLLIYHYGYGRQNMLAILKVSTLCCLSAVVFIIAPAHVYAGTSYWIVALILLGGFVPLTLVNWLTRPFVTQIWLQLPPNARQSAKAALEYARNIPADATLDLRFLRVTGLEGRIVARIRDLHPVLSGSWRPVTFKWQGRYVDRGTLLRPNPTEFYVKPESAKGAASKDTIPGLWAALYKRVTGVDADAVSKWRR